MLGLADVDLYLQWAVFHNLCRLLQSSPSQPYRTFDLCSYTRRTAAESLAFLSVIVRLSFICMGLVHFSH